MFNYNLCAICQDSISDPICGRCYLKQTEILLNDFEVHSIANEVILREVKDKTMIETLNDIECILCKRENVAMCHYCFSIILTKILRELNFTEDFIENLGYSPKYEEISLEKKSRPGIEIEMK